MKSLTFLPAALLLAACIPTTGAEQQSAIAGARIAAARLADSPFLQSSPCRDLPNGGSECMSAGEWNERRGIRTEQDAINYVNAMGMVLPAQIGALMTP